MATPTQPWCIELAHFSDKDKTPAVAFIRWTRRPPGIAERWRTRWHPVCEPHIPEETSVLVSHLAEGVA